MFYAYQKEEGVIKVGWWFGVGKGHLGHMRCSKILSHVS